MIEEFLNQEDELEAFITGGAGTGKTTTLKEIVEYLNKQRITYQVVAYTHKAKEVLISKLPPKSPVSTLHSWLKKRPTINKMAKHTNALMTSTQFGDPEPLQLLIVDEFSFVGEEDYMSIVELQDQELYCEEGCYDGEMLWDNENNHEVCAHCKGKLQLTIPLKVLYVGDPNQLPPVKGMQSIMPGGKFHKHLTHVWRSGEGLQATTSKLVRIIEGEEPLTALPETEVFHKEQDIVSLYKQDTGSKIMLAYTNETVERLNQEVQGYKEPLPGDKVYSSTMRQTYTFVQEVRFPYIIHTAGGEVMKGAKYKPLEFISDLFYVKFYEVTDPDTLDNIVLAGIFGSYQNKLIREELGKTLTKLNAEGKDSKKAYREYKSVSDLVCQIDFSHCLTIHKSQGQEFDNVYLDINDLNKCQNEETLVKLAYVAISRAKKEVFTT